MFRGESYRPPRVKADKSERNNSARAYSTRTLQKFYFFIHCFYWEILQVTGFKARH